MKIKMSRQPGGTFYFRTHSRSYSLRFVAISDTHCRHRSLRMPDGDVLLHAGDVSYHSIREEVIDFLDWIERLPYAHKIFIAGNHDFFFERTKTPVLESLIPEGVHYLKDEAVTIGGIKIWGSPYTPWYYQWAFNKRRGEPLAKHWQMIPSDTDILLTHGPAHGILDTVVNDRHVGDRDLLTRILEVKPKVHVCGHIHEAYGTVRKQGIRFINACVLSEGYELMNKAFVFDLHKSSALKEVTIHIEGT